MTKYQNKQYCAALDEIRSHLISLKESGEHFNGEIYEPCLILEPFLSSILGLHGQCRPMFDMPTL